MNPTQNPAIDQLREVISGAIIAPNRDEAQRMSDWFSDAGYRPRIASTTGRFVVHCRAPFVDIIEACKHALVTV